MILNAFLCFAICVLLFTRKALILHFVGIAFAVLGLMCLVAYSAQGINEEEKQCKEHGGKFIRSSRDHFCIPKD